MRGEIYSQQVLSASLIDHQQAFFHPALNALRRHRGGDAHALVKLGPVRSGSAFALQLICGKSPRTSWTFHPPGEMSRCRPRKDGVMILVLDEEQALGSKFASGVRVVLVVGGSDPRGMRAALSPPAR